MLTQTDESQSKGNTPRSVGDEDIGLLVAVRARDLRAFEQLYRRYQPRLTRFVANLVRRPPIVEEVVNDTLMVMWDRSDSFTGASKLSTWLFTIAYRKALRARSRQDEPVEDRESEHRTSSDEAPDHALGRDRTRAALLRAMEDLSPDHRAVIDLTYFHEIGYREIAEIMECPVDTVKTRMFHARRHLRRRLAGELADWI
ncbi:MAG: sigma-70 family RNA polymerase sigma factor [Sphingomonas sp.]